MPLKRDDGDEDDASEMGYQQTLMYGRYSKSLGEFAKDQAKRKRKEIELQRRKAEKTRKRELSGTKPKGRVYKAIVPPLTYLWQHTFAKVGEDWVLLALLGISMAIVSFIMDEGISHCNKARQLLYQELSDDSVFLRYIAWVSLPVSLVLFAAGFVQVVSPQAIGSGIPELKTILRGVVLKEYLTAKTFIAKAVGLTATLGSGMPLGKEGPFVHIASIFATILRSAATKFDEGYNNEARQGELLAAACAVGVACCFAAPIGGVLFSIEVTSVFFAVRNYWRGFIAAVIGATTFRLLAVIFRDEPTIIALFRTDFNPMMPYDAKEILIFAVIGIVSGCGGALYVYCHRRYVLWMRGNKSLNKFLQKNRFIYPFLISFIISTLSFPDWAGKYHVSQLGTHGHIQTLFSEHSWINVSYDNSTILTREEIWVKDYWNTESTDYMTNMIIFMLVTFFTSILALTLPVPNGALIPAFKIGAALGRIVGEAFYIFFPLGVGSGRHVIAAGGYATIGAAAFTGAVTHTLSISVIIFELTGQITHAIPMLIAVILSTRIAELLQPSCYDSVIMIKKLPYLPNILPASSSVHRIFVEDFMIRDVKYIWYGMSYSELRDVLKDGKKLRSFPLVDRPDKMVLLGSIQRTELIGAIERQIGRERRTQEAMRRYQAEIEDQQNLYEESLRLISEQSSRQHSHHSSLAEQRPSLFDSLGIDPAMLQQLSSKPYNSILKKSSSYSINPSDSAMRQQNYRSVTAAEQPSWKSALENLQNLFKRSDQR